MQAVNSNDASKKNLTLILYLLYIVAIFSGGLLAIIALIINYVKRPDMQGTLYESHFNWQISTFWWYLFWNIIAFVPFGFLLFTEPGSSPFAGIAIGGLIFMAVVIFVAWVWLIYRHIRGIMRLNEDQAL